jgi:K+/H+ antiporter YhaU regulatory subunit KhtT
MRKLNVRHQRLPHIGDRFELDTASGMTIIVVSHPRSGRQNIGIAQPDGEEPLVTVALTKSEAGALAMLMTGAHIELTTTPGT